MGFVNKKIWNCFDLMEWKENLIKMKYVKWNWYVLKYWKESNVYIIIYIYLIK